MKVLLDTNAYSDWRRCGRWNGPISTAAGVCVPAVVLGELRYGFALSARALENEAKLVEFLQDPAVSVVPVGDGTSRCYAALKSWLRSARTPIPENDVWIAALAVEYGLPLLTGDDHFAALPQVARLVG